jgi:hypothetical protein
MTEHIIASLTTLTVWNYYPTKEAADLALPGVKEKMMQDSYKYNDNHVKYGYSDRDPNYWLKQAAKARQQAKDYQVMTWEEYTAAEAKQILSRPLTEITEQDFDDMLNVLPPMKWGTNRGIISFFMCEFHTGSYTRQYAKIGNRHFWKLVDYRKPETWISFEMVDHAVPATATVS